MALPYVRSCVESFLAAAGRGFVVRGAGLEVDAGAFASLPVEEDDGFKHSSSPKGSP